MQMFKFVPLKESVPLKNIYIIRNDAELENLSVQISDALSKKIKLRLKNECTAYLFVESGVLKGYMFCHHPNLRTVWHDCLPTNVSEGRIFDVYVFPEHRGKGLAPTLHCTLVNDMYSKGVSIVWSVVKTTNYNSLEYHQKVNAVKIKEVFIFKFVRCNIVSVVWPGLKIYLLFGRRRNKL